MALFVCMQQWCCCLPTRPCPRPPQVDDFGYRPVFVSFSSDVLLCISPPQYISRIRKAPRVPAAGELRLARGASHVACRLFVLPHPAPGVVKVRLFFRQRRPEKSCSVFWGRRAGVVIAIYAATRPYVMPVLSYGAVKAGAEVWFVAQSLQPRDCHRSPNAERTGQFLCSHFARGTGTQR